MRLYLYLTMLQFAFLLGIVFICFNLIWFLFSSILKMVLGKTGDVEKYILRVSQSYFLASVSALATINYGQHFYSLNVLVVVGSIVLFLYLINKIEQRRKVMQFNMQLNKNYVSFNSSNLKYDIIVALLTVIFYVYAVYSPACVQNGINDWLYESITNLYDMFFVGFVIGIIGVFFIISIFIKGFVSFQLIYKQFSEMINGKKPTAFEEKEGFTDYEIVEEDD